jgi:hypothetical protein
MQIAKIPRRYDLTPSTNSCAHKGYSYSIDAALRFFRICPVTPALHPQVLEDERTLAECGVCHDDKLIATCFTVRTPLPPPLSGPFSRILVPRILPTALQRSP